MFCTVWLGNKFRATTACSFSSLISADGSTALASLLFHPPEPDWKNSDSRQFYLFAHLRLLSSDSFSSLSHLFSSLTLPAAAFSSVHIVGGLTSKLLRQSIGIYWQSIWGLGTCLALWSKNLLQHTVKSSEERVVRHSATWSETHSEMQWIELRYSLCMSSFIYPVVVAWTWGGGWLSEFLKVGFTDLAGAFVKLLERSCSSCSMFPAVTVRCWVPGLGVVCRFWSNPKTRTKPQRWKPGTCCWVAKLG